MCPKPAPPPPVISANAGGVYIALFCGNPCAAADPVQLLVPMYAYPYATYSKPGARGKYEILPT